MYKAAPVAEKNPCSCFPFQSAIHPEQMDLVPTIHLLWLQDVAEHFVNGDMTKTTSPQSNSPVPSATNTPRLPSLEQHKISVWIYLFMCQLPFLVHLVWEEERLEWLL